MSGLGFVMLAHAALHRAGDVAAHWAAAGCPVVIHLDRRVERAEAAALAARLKGQGNIRILSRYACDWGRWGLVAATEEAAALLLREFPQVERVFLTSGACLPLRPVAELTAYLDAHPDTDFIESVTVSEVGWTVGGLSEERFTLRFPFSWRRQRRLFDGYVRLQRALGFRRRLPKGLTPHLGSQWWCLTRATLSAILEAPEHAARARYFRRVWIPDESYFQSLARLYARRIESRSLTLAKFDPQGRPYLFYDDHLPLLRRSDCFVARKIWPEAEALYRAFLPGAAPGPAPLREPQPGRIDRLFALAAERRLRGRPGLYMQSRFPRKGHENGKTAGPYTLCQGFDAVFENFEAWLAKTTTARVHGHLFAPEGAEFAGGGAVFQGGLPAAAPWRDYNPEAFLTNLLWNTRGERQVFQFAPGDAPAILPFIADDVNAEVYLISGAWAVKLFRRGGDFAALREEAARLQKAESEMITLFRHSWVKARLRLWNLGSFLENPRENVQALVEGLSPKKARALTEMPRLYPLAGFEAFLQKLRNEGMLPALVGPLPDLRGDLMRRGEEG